MSKQLVHEIRFGLIKGEIHLANTASGDRYDVSFVRLFRNGDKRQESTRFGAMTCRWSRKLRTWPTAGST
jgi:hypothetical protein